jgi:hypothetical protein
VEWVLGNSSVGAAGAEAFEVDQRPIDPSADAVRMRFDIPSYSRDSIGPLCPYNSNVGLSSPENWSSLSVYFQMRIVRSKPAEAIWVFDKNFAALMLELCPPRLLAGEVAITWPELFHILSSPS